MPDTLHIEPRAALPFPSVAAKALEFVRTAYVARRSPRGFAGVPTGLPTLDGLLGGLQTGLHIIGAEPGAGKTALALNIARHAAAVHGLPVVYASFDEVPERLALKVLAARAGFTMSDAAGGLVLPETIEAAIYEHRDALRCLSFIGADAAMTAHDLVAQLRGRLELHGQPIGLLVVDYLQPWAAAMAAQMPGADFRLAVGALALKVRALANLTACPVLLISAQNRSGQGTANMTSLRESSDLEYGADSILMLTKDDGAMIGGGKRALTLTVAKNRFGPSGAVIPLVLDGRTQVIRETAQKNF